MSSKLKTAAELPGNVMKAITLKVTGSPSSPVKFKLEDGIFLPKIGEGFDLVVGHSSTQSHSGTIVPVIDSDLLPRYHQNNEAKHLKMACVGKAPKQPVVYAADGPATADSFLVKLELGLTRAKRADIVSSLPSGWVRCSVGEMVSDYDSESYCALLVVPFETQTNMRLRPRGSYPGDEGAEIELWFRTTERSIVVSSKATPIAAAVAIDWD